MWRLRLLNSASSWSRGHPILLQNTGKLGHADADEAGIPHDIENVGERHWLEVVLKIRADRPLHVPVRGQAAARGNEGGGQPA